MKKLVSLAMLASAMYLVIAGASRADVITNTSVPFSVDFFVPCGSDTGGQNVHLAGDLHILLSLTGKDSTRVSAKAHYQPQGLSGVAADGTKYQATGVTQDMFEVNFVNGQATHTYVNNFRLIGQGPGNNFLVHENIHLTINANGIVTASVDNFKIDCK